MHLRQSHHWEHHHTFGTDEPMEGERRTRWVVALTLTMMVVEIVAGMVFGSMALLADGWHMGTHAAALGVAVFAYAFARKHSADPRYSFGTGKVGALGGFASAVGLAVVALVILVESVSRLQAPVIIRFDEAIGVAVIGLVVNLASALLLREDHHHTGEHAHHHHDHNLRGAYLHVLADALTSILAIVALVAGRQFGWTWMDPMMGIVGSVVIARWSYGLLGETSRVLLDAEVAPERQGQIRRAIESEADNRVVDLHLWRVGPKHLAAVVSVVCHEPQEPEHYKTLLAGFQDLAHITIEVHRCLVESCTIESPAA
ncbi:MAG: CDF family Co(II)/Ni(II) efflux transporter DmeF [Polyangiales bacterium]